MVLFLQDYRGPGDPNFTDTWVDGDQTWTHTYDLTGITLYPLHWKFILRVSRMILPGMLSFL